MGYPFYDNPLDEYLEKLSELKFREFQASCIALDTELTPDARASARKTVNAIYEEIQKLKSENELPARTFDCYKSLAELAIELFERDNPEPAKVNTYNCKHSKTQTARRIFRNDSLHVVLQCLDCGVQVKSLSKSEYSLNSLPEFDENSHYRITAERTLWERARYAVYQAEMSKGQNIPDYDYDAFDKKFQELDPPPRIFGCEHETTEPRLRTYSNGSTAVVLQCVRCGHHTGSASKTKYPNWQLLPAFDIALPLRAKKEYQDWCQRRHEASTVDRHEYREKVFQGLQKGELSWQNNSRYGTYYESPEWERTRVRILHRDDFQCQACKQAAECVHHILYDRLGAENDLDLISLCHDCHALIHKEQNKSHNLYRLGPSLIQSLHDTDDYDDEEDVWID
ncbi:HNH endonuclease [Pseudomonas asplenii]|uniref:HNH endonuclease n=1 Tax=Pseudomonas asplenii TaxID=53407 RepID=UPI0037C7D9CC